MAKVILLALLLNGCSTLTKPDPHESGTNDLLKSVRKSGCEVAAIHIDEYLETISIVCNKQ